MLRFLLLSLALLLPVSLMLLPRPHPGTPRLSLLIVPKELEGKSGKSCPLP